MMALLLFPYNEEEQKKKQYPSKNQIQQKPQRLINSRNDGFVDSFPLINDCGINNFSGNNNI